MALPSGPGSSDPDPADDDFDDERPDASATAQPTVASTGRRSRWPLQLVALTLLAAAVVAGAVAWRARHRREVVAQGLSRAEALLRSDTYSGYQKAEQLLEPLSELDPITPAALRGFALAMLALDYRDEDAARRAEALLLEPGRAREAPRWVHLGYGALALARQEAGTAMSYAARAADGTWPAVLQARVALLAGKPEVAREPLDQAAAADPGAPAVQALRGDVLRRTGHPAEAREAYAAALAASPDHPRAAFGLAKLALAGERVGQQAREALLRLLAEDALPANERARAALHLAALEARAGRRTEAAAAVERAPVDADARAWIARTVTEQARSTGYHVPPTVPAALQSASDDDPFVAPPRAPLSSAIAPTFRMPEPPPRAAPAVAATPKAATKPARAAAPAPAKGAPAVKKKPSAAKPAVNPVAKRATGKKATAAKGKAAAEKKAISAKPPPKKKPVAAKRPLPAERPARTPAPRARAPEPGEESALERAMTKVR